MATPKYLRQLKSGTIYNYTEALAKRRDMVPHDETQAKARIAALKTILEGRQPDAAANKIAVEEAFKAKTTAQELAGLETTMEKHEDAAEKKIEEEGGGKKLNDQTPVTPEQTAKQLRQDRLENDPKYNNVMAMKSKNQVEEYMLLEFGQEIEASRPFKDLKAYAVEQTIKRILEE